MRLRRREFLFSLGLAGLARQALGRAEGVKLGVCRKPQDLEKAVEYGFDYLEPSAADVAALDAAAFETFKTQVFASPIRCESFNVWIRNLKVVGEEVRTDDLKQFVVMSLDRCRQLGGRIVVWGSSGSRNVPEGFPRERAWEQIKSFLRMAGDEAGRNDLTIGIEPLRHQESNIINTGAEALQLVREVNHPRVKMIIDYFHLRQENEDPEILWKARQEIVHLHFANPHGRVWPHDPTEDPEYAEFFKLVKRIHYHGRISIEARGSFQQDAHASLRFFREELA